MHALFSLVGLWLGVQQRVGRRAYAVSGVGLMLFKYAVEFATIAHYTGKVYSPLDFINPLFDSRMNFVGGLPTELQWAAFVWTLVFLWIALSMSVRRAADAGWSPWSGLLVLVPVFNLVVMVLLCFALNGPNESLFAPRSSRAEAHALSAVIGVTLGMAVGALMLAVSVYGFGNYGTSFFFGTPLVMGAIAGYWDNRQAPHGYTAAMGLGLAAVFFSGVALLLVALEGAICIAMAYPLLLPVGAAGGALGKAIADSTRRPTRELLAVVAALPLWAGMETQLPSSPEYEVLTAVEIDAPPEVVWQCVLAFPDLPPAGEWYFRAGIAAPERARIVGTGVGATRYCEFTTGVFVEPITVWDEPRRLAFNVTDQPDPMTELSPYHHVHPPHLDGALRSKRGEFRLIPLAGGRTRLEGRTWYEFEMFPQFYWTLWSDLIIHRIHVRVLEHIRQLAEEREPSRAIAKS